MTSVELCHICGGEASLIRQPNEVHLGHRVVVVESERMRCSECEAEYYLPGQMQAEQRAAASKVRQEEGLLAETAIRRIRDRLGLTQSEMERLLGVGPKTVVRWERGTVFQSSAVDKLLRVIADVPGAAEYLAHLQGVKLPDGVHQPSPPNPIVSPSAEVIRLAASETSGPTMHDPQVLHMEDYRRRRSDMQPIPADLLREAQL